MDLISVIVPIYKVEKYLDCCVRSIVEQTYQNLEIILVDDGSPDNCPAICDEWAKKDHRIKVIHKENGGLSDARNAGMAIASGEYISFIDSDDSVEPSFLSDLYEALIKHNADIAECAVSYVDESGAEIRHRSAAEISVMDKMEALHRLVLENGVYQTVWNKLYRRSTALAIPFAVGKYNEDEFWTYQVLDCIQTLAIVNKPLYRYLQRGSSIIGVGYNIRRLDGLEARFQRMEYLQKYEELSALTRQQLILDCMWHYQCAFYTLVGQSQKHAISIIQSIMSKIPHISNSQLTLNWKYRLWLFFFKVSPVLTAKIRNGFRIGL